MMRRFVAGVVLTLLAGLAGSGTAAASGVAVSQTAAAGTEQVLFRAGTNGYGCFRIPALVRTAQGSLLAFAEARRSPSCADRGDIDTVVRRSTNNGRTWGPIQVALAGRTEDPFAPFTRGNAAPVVDQRNGRIHLLSTSNEASLSGRRLPWRQFSDDDGVTWSAATLINGSFDGTTNGWFATGPGHGIQLASGRLVIGAHQKPSGKVVNAGVLYSDTYGETWQATKAVNSYVDKEISPGEISPVELADGRLLALARNEFTDVDHRVGAVSEDGGATMPAFTTVPSLVSSSVQGSVLALKSTYQRTPGDTLIFSSPSDPVDRKTLAIRYSTNNGASWTTPARGVITTERAGYSDLAELTDGQIGVLYEGGAAFSADEIRFNRFSPAEIGLPGTFTGNPSTQPSKGAAATTPDVSSQGNDAYPAGNATINQGLVLDGAGDYADIPHSPGIDPGDGDFTYTTSFTYSANASSPAQALLWAFGAGAGTPQLWLRAQPAQDQLYAWVQGDTGATVTLKDTSAAFAFGDNVKHNLTLSRSGGKITLTVDGVSASATGVTGSVNAGTTGIRLGAKQDPSASDGFDGTLGEFRFYRSATADARNLNLRLPFAVLDGATSPSRSKVTMSEDLSANCSDATMLGGLGSLVDGRSDGTRALQVSPSRPGAETPFTRALDVGSGDFTITTWFKYSSGTGNQVLVWAYGATAGKRSVWVRAQPAENRLYAWVETDAGAVGVALLDSVNKKAFGDNVWHAMALTRTGDQLRLSVGTQSATATGLTGSVTANKADILGLRAGSKPDGTDVFTGALDDVRVYPRALTLAEVITPPLGELPSLWWSFESGHTQAHDVVRLADGPSTPDYSTHCGGGYVRGGAAPGAGKFGGALTFDGTDDTVQLPYSPSTALGGEDFTISTWLKYTATSTTADQVIVWAYGVGTNARSLWLRAQPSKDRLYAYAQTDTGGAGVTGTDSSANVAFGNGVWHHLALRRSAGVLSLIVDGTTVGSTAIQPGSLSYGDAFEATGFQLGARLDGFDRLRGSLDEFRIFRKALSTAELNSVLQNNVELGTVTAVRLPFETVSATPHARM